MQINKLLRIFRGALEATIPWITKVGIKWKDGEAYDDWDNIATALYESIVSDSCVFSVTKECSLPKYDFVYKDYKHFDFIAAYAPHHQERLLAFVGFASIASPLDKVKLTMLDDEYNAIAYDILYDLKDLTFFFNQIEDGKRKKYAEVLITP